MVLVLQDLVFLSCNGPNHLVLHGHCTGKFQTSLQQYSLMVLVFKGLVIMILVFESGFDRICIWRLQ